MIREIEWKHPLAVALIALLIAFARMPDRLIYGFLWGEDGKIFLLQAYDLGARSLVTPYAGYLHAIPRLIAYVFSKFGRIDHAARLFAWMSAAVLCATCSYLFAFSRKVLPLPAAWIFGLAPILVPASGEVWLSITNLQWITAPALLVLLWDEFCWGAAESTSWIGDVTRCAAIVLMTLTGPFGLLFLPAVVIGVGVNRNMCRSRRTWIAIAAYFTAVSMQFALIASFKDSNSVAGASAYLHFPWQTQFLRHLALEFAMPREWIARIGNGWSYTALIVTAVMGASIGFANRTLRLRCAGLAALAITLWAVGVVRQGTPQTDMMWAGYGARYFYVPFIFMAWMLLVSFSTTRHSTVRFATGFLLTMALINSFENIQAPVWLKPGVVYHAETNTWQVVVSPGPGWFVDVSAAQINR